MSITIRSYIIVLYNFQFLAKIKEIKREKNKKTKINFKISFMRFSNDLKKKLKKLLKTLDTLEIIPPINPWY